MLFALDRADGGPWRLGLTATRKSGNAVARNRMRRRAREFFRRRGHLLPAGWDIVVNLRKGGDRAPWAEVVADYEKCLRRLGVAMPAPAEAGEAR